MLLNKKSFAYQAGLLALANTALMLLFFAYRIVLGRLSGPEGLGVHTLVMQVYVILMSVSAYGLCGALTHSAASLAPDLGGIRKATRFALSCFLGLFLLMALPTLFLGDFIAGDILGDIRAARALYMVLACVLLTGVENILKAVLYGLRMVKYTAISEVGEQTLRILFAALVLGALINSDIGYTAFLIMCVMTLSELYSVVVLGIVYYTQIIRKSKRSAQSAKSIRRRFMELALPSTLTSILGNVFASVTVILFPLCLTLAGMSRSQAVSLLGVISGMLMPILMLPSALINAVCTLLMPSIASCAARHDEAGTRVKADRGIEVIGLIGIPAMILLLPFVPILCAIVFKQTIAFALIVLMTLEAIVSFYIILVNSILNGMGRQKLVLLLTGSRELLQLSLVWVLASRPELNVYGYAIGLLGGDILHAIWGLHMVHRCTKTRPRPFHAVIAPVACAIVLYMSARLMFFGALSYGLTLIAAALSSLFIGFALYILLLRLLGIRPLRYLRRVMLQGGA